MSARCPSDLALEEHLLQGAASKVAPHVAACASCEARLAVMRQQGEEFNRFVFPSTVDAVTGPRRAPWLRWLLVGAPVAAAAGVLLLVLRPAGPASDYTGSKGAPLALTVFSGGEGATAELPDGAAVPPDASLRFRVRAARPCRLWIFSLDDTGQVSRLFPRDGPEGAAVQGSAAPPGGAVLDGRVGVERLFAVCCAPGLPFEVVERAAAQVPRGPAGVRAAGVLAGLPEGAAQATVLLEKRR